MAAGGWIAFSGSRTRPGEQLGVVDKHLEERMLRRPYLLLAAALLTGGVSLHAQEPVVGASDPEALFHSSDPKLAANKQGAYHIVRDLLEAGHWELADKYLTERYVQHNPHAASGRDGVVKYFTEVRKVKPVPIPAKMKTKVVAVVAEGDLVVVAYVRALKDANDSSRSYTTTWFDMWRLDRKSVV